tara:strand:+ start:23007 stop:23690 length:684 start_codon:yes stop_codon:yes gene_type:complete
VIYVLDDDQDFLEIMVAYLNRMDLEHTTFSDPEEYKAKVIENAPQLSLIDLNFKGSEKGFNLIKGIRSRGDSHPIIVVSGSKNPEALTYALECGASDYIFKPIDRPTLNNKLSNFIHSSELENWLGMEVEVPNGGEKVSLLFDGEVISIDELGFEMATTHFIPAGTQLQISGSIWSEIFDGKSQLSFFVSKSTYNREMDCFKSHCDYLDITDEQLSGIRNWILKKQE